MLDRRKSCRGRVFYGGRIAFNGRQSTMDCLVRNFSDGGARVEFGGTPLITDEVDLTIDRKGLAFRASMIWRRGDHAGFVFRNPRQVATPMPLDWALRLRASERATRELLQQVDRWRSAY
jgi:hypothetical protein